MTHHGIKSVAGKPADQQQTARENGAEDENQRSSHPGTYVKLRDSRAAILAQAGPELFPFKNTVLVPSLSAGEFGSRDASADHPSDSVALMLRRRTPIRPPDQAEE